MIDSYSLPALSTKHCYTLIVLSTTSTTPAVSDNYLIMFLFLTFDNLLQPELNQGKKETATKVCVLEATLWTIQFLTSTQWQQPLWYSARLHPDEEPYPPVDSDSDCYPWTIVWEDSLILRLLYWLDLVQRFWLAASLRPVLTPGFWFG